MSIVTRLLARLAAVPSYFFANERANVRVEYDLLLANVKAILKWLSARAEHDMTGLIC